MTGFQLDGDVMDHELEVLGGPTAENVASVTEDLCAPLRQRLLGHFLDVQ